METPREPSAPPAWARWALVAITVAAAVVRPAGLGVEEPWFDEVFSIVLAAQDLGELWRRAVADETNPPGFYLLLWGWARIGGLELPWLRLLPLLAATLAVPATAFAARAAGLGWTGALVAATLAAASPPLLAMSSEVRTYALMALLSALAMTAAARRRTALTAAAGVALVLFHYFGAFVVAALFVATLWDDRTRWRAAIAGALPAALTLGAWLALVFRAAQRDGVGSNASWIPDPGAGALVSFASQVVGTFGTPVGRVASALVCAVAFAVALRAMLARERSPLRLHAALAVASVPLACVALLSAVGDRELWVPRYLIVTLPGWWVLLGAAVERTRGHWREVAVAALLTWAALAGLRAEQARERKTAWSQVVRALTAGGPRTICSAESYVALPLRYQALREGLPLVVLDLDACTPARAPDAILLRRGTEAAIGIVAGNGARAGVPRDLGTSLPPTVLVPLEWPAR